MKKNKIFAFLLALTLLFSTATNLVLADTNKGQDVKIHVNAKDELDLEVYDITGKVEGSSKEAIYENAKKLDLKNPLKLEKVFDGTYYKYTFDGKDKGLYLVIDKNEKIENFIIDGQSGDINAGELNIEAKPKVDIEKPKEDPKVETISIKVEKRWENTDKDKKEAISVELLENGKSTGKRVDLSEKNNWKDEFKDLPVKDKNDKKITYTVIELGEKNNKITLGGIEYSVKVDGNQDKGFVITNIAPKQEKKKPEEKPKTNDDSSAKKVAIIGAGLVVLGLGGYYFVNKKKED